MFFVQDIFLKFLQYFTLSHPRNDKFDYKITRTHIKVILRILIHFVKYWLVAINAEIHQDVI